MQTNITGAMVATGYLYDAEGRRVAKGSITASTSTPLRSSMCNAATNGFQTTESYVLGQADEELTTYTWNGSQSTWARSNVYGGGVLLATYDANGSGLHFHLTDSLGTRRVQTDPAGTPETDCQSLPYGDALNCFAPPGSAATGAAGDDATPLHFTGKQRDTESGNDYFDARYYASAAARFLSPDWSAKVEPVPYAKMDNPQSMNLYAYVGNDPLGGVDPNGHGRQPSLPRFGCSEGEHCDGTNDKPYDSLSAAEKANLSEDYVFGGGVGLRPDLAQQQGQAVSTVYNETGGLKPDPSSDPNSAAHLQTARQNVAHVYKNTKGKGFPSIDHLAGREKAALAHGNPDSVAAYSSSEQAVAAANRDRVDPTGGATHIYLYDLSPNSTQHVPAWVTNGNPTTVEGPFINAAGGGDVRVGAPVLILTIKDQ